MSSHFRSPGVYRQDVFLRAPAKLPTGIPAFVGFAAAAAPLDRLPQPLRLPERAGYDAAARRLTFAGQMSDADASELAALSADPAFSRAVQALSRNARPVMAVQRAQEFFDNFASPAGGFLGEAVAGFFRNGGVRCYVARAALTDTPAGNVKALSGALDALAPLTDLDLVAVPDAMLLNLSTGVERTDPDKGVPNVEAILEVQAAALTHCARNLGRFAILDPVRGASPDAVRRQRSDLAIRANEVVSGALYYPWVLTAARRLVPPCGHVAGIYARSDGKAGVFKAPANEELFGVLDLERRVTTEMQDGLNPLGVNCLRAFPGRGIRVWGARTLSREESWRYVNVRRLFLTICRWTELNMPWASFEPNEPRLWVRVQRELGAYLRALWEAGALIGQTPEQAFYVKCDAETNPPESRELGQVITEIGVAPTAPAEFVVVRILHRAGTTEAL
jgi:uncharacterized protein